MDAETRAELAALRSEVAALRGERGAAKRRHGTRGRRGAALLLALLLALLPLGMLAANPVFSDLGDAAVVHQPNIQAIGNAGITTGFDDPANPGQRTYNPKGLVTREEMASFLARTAGLGGNPPVANALTAVTAGNAIRANNATTAQTATNADHATTATTATNSTNATHASTADSATQATNAGNATTLGGYAADSLTRIAFTSAPETNIVPLNSNTVVVQVTIIVPGSVAQAVAVHGKVHLHGQPSGGEIRVLIYPDSGSGPFSSGSIFPYLNNNIDTGIMVYDDWVFSAAPGKHTYQLIVTNSSTAGSLYTGITTMTATTYPFGGNGTAGTTEIVPTR